MSDFVRNGETGFLFESGNVKKLAEKIIEVLGDKDLFEKLSINCRKFGLANFTPTKHYKKVAEIYKIRTSL